VGIVGVGHVGSALARKLSALGLAPVLCDPPRAEREGQAGFASLEEALACDVVSLHVPLDRGGGHPSWHLLDAARLRALRPGAILVNAARGAVVDNAALKACLAGGQALAAVLDVWEGEPRPDPELAARVAIATPHIAGYSLDGKLRGTMMVYQAFCRHFGLEPVMPDLDALELPRPEALRLDGNDEAALRAAVLACYDPRRDDAALRASLAEPEPGLAFDRLRKHYPVRREFGALRVSAPAGAAWLEALGFSRG
jgi:erythronate-4-phosphate dehydrogenase